MASFAANPSRRAVAESLAKASRSVPGDAASMASTSAALAATSAAPAQRGVLPVAHDLGQQDGIWRSRNGQIEIRIDRSRQGTYFDDEPWARAATPDPVQDRASSARRFRRQRRVRDIDHQGIGT